MVDFPETPAPEFMAEVELLDKSSSPTGVAPSTLSWNGLTLTRAVNTVDSASIYRDASVY